MNDDCDESSEWYFLKGKKREMFVDYDHHPKNMSRKRQIQLVFQLFGY